MPPTVVNAVIYVKLNVIVKCVLIPVQSGSHARRSATKDLDKVLKQLQKVVGPICVLEISID